jgi:hypothetical protein
VRHRDYVSITARQDHELKISAIQMQGTKNVVRFHLPTVLNITTNPLGKDRWMVLVYKRYTVKM